MSTAYEQYESLLIALHCLMAQGEGDSVEAHALRERMDEPWYACSEVEKRELEALYQRLQKNV